MTRSLFLAFVDQSFGLKAAHVERVLQASFLSHFEKARQVSVCWFDCRDKLDAIAGDYSMVKDAQKAEQRGEFLGFVNIYLDDAQKADILERVKKVKWAELWGWVGAQTGKGYKFSFSWDNYSSAQQVAMFCWAEGDPNHGRALSARHPDLDMALYTLFYKSEYVALGDWSCFIEKSAAPSWG